jgi:hypothetical protein
MKKRYMNSYMAGTLLGIVLLASMFISGRGLGASGGIKYCVVSIVGAVDRPHAENSIYYSKYFEEGKKPLTNWLSLEIFGVVAGGFISGAVSGRLKLKVEKSPKISVRSAAGQRMYQRCSFIGNGSTLSCRICHHDCHLRISIFFCMVFQKELDIKKA